MMSQMTGLDQGHLWESTRHALSLHLQGISEGVDVVRFMNYEGVPEWGDVQRPFSEITLFKPSPEATSTEIRPLRHTWTVGRAKTHTQLYTNGKSAGRIRKSEIRKSRRHEDDLHDDPETGTTTCYLEEFGPHDFQCRQRPSSAFSPSLSPSSPRVTGIRWELPTSERAPSRTNTITTTTTTNNNNNNNTRRLTYPGLVVLHYPYSSPAAVVAKGRRPDACPDGRDLSECIYMPADRNAFLAAHLGAKAAEDHWWGAWPLVDGSWISCGDDYGDGSDEAVCGVDAHLHATIMTAVGLYVRYPGISMLQRVL
jgi:hypothetical protein